MIDPVKIRGLQLGTSPSPSIKIRIINPELYEIIPSAVMNKTLRNDVWYGVKKPRIHIMSDDDDAWPDLRTPTRIHICSSCDRKDTIAPTMELIGCQRAAWAMAAMKMKGPNSVTIQRG